MKHVVVLGDGMADCRIPELEGKTPLMCAVKPNMDFLAVHGEMGTARTIPEGMPTGSEVANLSVLGYDPRVYFTGRSPMEAVGMGVTMSDTDVAFRCNLVTLSGDEPYGEKTMVDYCSDEISSAEACEIIDEVNRHLRDDRFRFHPGISYRHCLIWKDGITGNKLTPPHDILGKKVAPYLPDGPGEDILREMMRKSAEFLAGHPVNRKRKAGGLNPANSIWLWGEGKRPALVDFNGKYGISGSVVSAVDLIKGIGICAGMRIADVEGATGNINTNFSGKAEAALAELESGRDFVYIHVEAPDECGHRYEIENKVRSIELIDRLVLGTLLKGLDANYPEYRVMVLPDHPTPLPLRTHTADPVPYVIYEKSKDASPFVPIPGVNGYDEEQAGAGPFIDEGFRLMERFILS